MQRSNVQRTIIRFALGVLACAMLGVFTPARAAQPVTVTTRALTHAPSGSGYVPVTNVKPGDHILYEFDLEPKFDITTPVSITIEFDTRLEYYTIGSDGACIGLYDDVSTLTCVDPFNGTKPLARLTTVWVWFTVKASTIKTPLIMRATTANDVETISTLYDVSTVSLLPIFYR